ncbi:LVIVD repeat-containing protein [Naasia lichenicola]|uniref:LVIVD repeat-containing protein n=1 Tax=Naasia lichenicola TaxID=2565933 RepID=A0A4S4FN02_9MICO|nr:hypothetical protein [Naasia lichenicola]THG31574.1 hypothetical protein E6C64_05725 [Naasia lichenicola]
MQSPIQPDHASNFSFLGYSDQGGRGDGLQVMVNRGHAYVAHMFSNGFSVIDVRDPRTPEPRTYVAAPPGTWNLHLQAADDLLLVVNAANLFATDAFADEANYYGKSVGEVFANRPIDYTAGLRVFDISRPDEPREIGFTPVDGVGLHRIWYTGGRWAYASVLLTGFTDYTFITIDMADPSHPQMVGQWWIPGQNLAAGETPTWDAKRWRYGLHHALVAGDTAYGAWRDGGLTILDVSDRAKPELIVHKNWSPPFEGGTHSPLPLPDRDLLVVADEGIADNAEDGIKRTWIFDIRDPANPISLSTLPIPDDADYVAKGGHFGPHNLHENRPGSFVSSTTIFATQQNAGLRAYDISDPFAPRESGAWVPPQPETMFDVRPNRPRVIQSADVFVDANGVAYMTDYNAGLYILQFDGE